MGQPVITYVMLGGCLVAGLLALPVMAWRALFGRRAVASIFRNGGRP